MPPNPQQATAQKITPIMITGMFLFFPLPAGVLLYMVIVLEQMKVVLHIILKNLPIKKL